MKIELHLHTSLHSACSLDTPQALLRAARAEGYGAVFLTEHDQFWSSAELAELQAQFPDILILPGVELSMGDALSQHLLVLGTTDHRYIKRKDSDPLEVLRQARQEGLLTVLAHPYRWGDPAALFETGVLPDALENLTGNHDRSQAVRSALAAQRYGLRLVNTDDAHGVDMVGQFWIETDRPARDFQEIRRMILAGEYRNGQR